MEERNELNDIILNKTEQKGSNKKLLVAIATFAIILIIVVVVMNKLGGSKVSSLPHPPKKRTVVVEEVVQEPDYAEKSVPVIENSIEHTSELVEEEIVEEIDVIPESSSTLKEPVYSHKKATRPAQKSSVKLEKKVTKTAKSTSKSTRPSGKYNPKTKSFEERKTTAQPKPTVTKNGHYYVQVGSFAKYAPSKKFLNKITKRGYTYTYHKVTRNSKTLNKVLVGPFKTKAAAREALPVIKRSVEPGAFLTKI